MGYSGEPNRHGLYLQEVQCSSDNPKTQCKMVPDEYFKGEVHHQAVGEASPEDEEKLEGGKETESSLGMCKGPVEGAWPMQGTGRQPGGGQCVLR